MNFSIDRSNDVAIVRLEEARLMYPLLNDFAAVDKADHYDMPAERDAFKIAALMLVFGDDFDWREPWALKIVAERLSTK